jgi:hypothetical protein
LIPSFKKVRTDDAPLRSVQDSLTLTLDQVIRREILDGNLVENIDLINGVNLIDHGLGRVPKGFIIVKRNDIHVVWNVNNSRMVAVKNMALQSNGAMTVSIWFF